MNIGIALFDGAEELDWVGPWEVLSAWATQWPEDDISVFTVAEAERPVECAKGLRVLPHHTRVSAPWIDCPRLPWRVRHATPTRRRPASSTGFALSRMPAHS